MVVRHRKAETTTAYCLEKGVVISPDICQDIKDVQKMDHQHHYRRVQETVSLPLAHPVALQMVCHIPHHRHRCGRCLGPPQSIQTRPGLATKEERASEKYITSSNPNRRSRDGTRAIQGHQVHDAESHPNANHAAAGQATSYAALYPPYGWSHVCT